MLYLSNNICTKVHNNTIKKGITTVIVFLSIDIYIINETDYKQPI